MSDAESPKAPELDAMPGHLVRRLQQISVGIFLHELHDVGVTPLQYSALQTVHHQPGIDQRTLASLIALDASTTAGVVDRLEARAWLVRNTSPSDKRVRLLSLTPAGEALLQQVIPEVQKSQELLMAPLPPRQREDFMRMLKKLVTENNAFSRAPSETPR